LLIFSHNIETNVCFAHSHALVSYTAQLLFRASGAT